LRDDPAAVQKSIDALVKEVRDLRVKSDNDDNMVSLLEQQRADARRELEGLRAKHARETEAMRIRYEDEISQLRGKAEEAEQKALAVNDTLQDVAQRILEAARRMAGQTMPQVVVTEDTHHLLRDTLD
jgi:predicted  nucleic acid-binding Zn-ribbon protein